MSIVNIHQSEELESFWSHYGPGVDSASNRNEYQEYFLGVKGVRRLGLTTLPSSWTDCHEICEPQPLATFRASTGIALPLPLPSRLGALILKILLPQVDCITTWRRVVEKVEVVQLLKKFPPLSNSKKVHYCVHKSYLLFPLTSFIVTLRCYFLRLLWLCWTCR